jgi:hypothetical protein
MLAKKSQIFKTELMCLRVSYQKKYEEENFLHH